MLIRRRFAVRFPIKVQPYDNNNNKKKKKKKKKNKTKKKKKLKIYIARLFKSAYKKYRTAI